MKITLNGMEVPYMDSILQVARSNSRTEALLIRDLRIKVLPPKLRAEIEVAGAPAGTCNRATVQTMQPRVCTLSDAESAVMVKAMEQLEAGVGVRQEDVPWFYRVLDKLKAKNP